MVPAPGNGELPFPSKLPDKFEELRNYLPKYEDFGFKKHEIRDKDERAALDFIGGEDAGLKRLDEYLW